MRAEVLMANGATDNVAKKAASGNTWIRSPGADQHLEVEVWDIFSGSKSTARKKRFIVNETGRIWSSAK